MFVTYETMDVLQTCHIYSNEIVNKDTANMQTSD